MFLQITTNGATDIVINIPVAGAEKSLPAIVSMFETNAVFINNGYNAEKMVKPDMKILLGKSVKLEQRYGEELVIVEPAPSDAVLDDSFVIATPDLFVSNEKSRLAKEAEITKLRTELAFVKSERDGFKESFEEARRVIASFAPV